MTQPSSAVTIAATISVELTGKAEDADGGSVDDVPAGDEPVGGRKGHRDEHARVRAGGARLEVSPLRVGPGFRVYSLLPRTTFSWQSVMAGARQTYDLGAYVPLEEISEALLVVRAHDVSLAAGQRVELVLDLVSLTEDEPETVFTSGVPLASVQIDSSTEAGTGRFVRLGDDLGLHGRLVLRFDQAPAAVSGSATLSAELVTRILTDEPEEDACECAHG